MRLAAVVALVSVSSAASNSTKHEVDITLDVRAVTFHRCFFNSSGLRN